MTDQELIKALKCCGSDGYNCRECPCFGDCEADCGNRAPALAADRLEALLAENAELNIQIQKEIVKRVDVEAENERLKAQLPKWRPASEPPEEYGEYLCRARSSTKKGECYTVTMKYDEYGWKEDDILYTKRVTHWMPLPSTEGVEQ